MNIPLTPELETRLQEVARRESLTIPQLVERVLCDYLNSLPEDDRNWVQGTQKALKDVWPVEDFTDWRPPDVS